MDKLIPVVVIKELNETDKILTALKNSGINCAEITFRTDCAKEAIEYAVKNYPDMNIGAGTVINAKQCEDALKAGAKFIVSPGLSVSVAEVCRENGVPYYPGCVTPTEIMQALDLGITTVKFFPANVYGGLKAGQVVISYKFIVNSVSFIVNMLFHYICTPLIFNCRIKELLFEQIGVSVNMCASRALSIILDWLRTPAPRLSLEKAKTEKTLDLSRVFGIFVSDYFIIH